MTRRVRGLGLDGALPRAQCDMPPPPPPGPVLRPRSPCWPPSRWAPGKPAVASTQQGLLPSCPVAMAPAAAVDSHGDCNQGAGSAVQLEQGVTGVAHGPTRGLSTHSPQWKG